MHWLGELLRTTPTWLRLLLLDPYNKVLHHVCPICSFRRILLSQGCLVRYQLLFCIVRYLGTIEAYLTCVALVFLIAVTLSSEADSLKNKVLELHWWFVKARAYKLKRKKFHVLSSTLAFMNCQCNSRTLFFKESASGYPKLHSLRQGLVL